MLTGKVSSIEPDKGPQRAPQLVLIRDMVVQSQSYSESESLKVGSYFYEA